MATCSVKECSSSHRRCKKNGENLSFFRVPAGSAGHKWKELGEISTTLKTPRVCSKHFHDDQFYDPANRTILRSHELPCLLLPSQTALNYNDLNPTEQMEVIQRQIQDNLVQKLTTKVHTLEDRVARLNRTLEMGRLRYRIKRRTLVRQRDSARKEAALLKTKNSDLRNRLETSTDTLRKVFSEAQVRVLQNDQTKAKWSEADISKAIVLKAKSTSAYNLVRSAWKVPLPGVSTLQRWTSQIEFEQGVLKSVISLLKEQFKNSTDFEKLCVLCYDEMALDGLMCYDQKSQKIVGPHANMMVVYARGLFSNWKQPIFYEYDYQVKKDGMFRIINALAEAGLTVCAVTCDLCPANRSIRTELDVNMDKTYFINPVNGKTVWVFYDLPHLIKRLRDHTIDNKIKLADGTTFTVADWWRIIYNDNNEIKICHKLTKKHLTVRGRERMNVRMAMQFYSGSVAKCFRHFFGFDSRLQNVANFTQLVNDFVDLMNSRHLDQNNFSGSDQQMEILKNMETAVLGMRVGRRVNTLLPFQEGIIISIRSLRGLFADLTQPPLKIKYLLTHRLNQDVAENGFGMIRGMGRFNTHPTAIEARHRLKLLMLGWTFNTSKNSSTQCETQNAPFVTSGLLGKLMTPKASQTTVSPIVHLPEQASNAMECIDPIISDTINETTWKEYYESQSFNSRFGANAEEYVYGYILWKVRDKVPDTGLAGDLQARFPESWVQSTSKKLTIPSYSWLNTFRKFDQYFQVYHSRVDDGKFEVNRSPSVCKGLELILGSYFPEVPEVIIQTYVKVRTMIRIKAINLELKKLRFRHLNKDSQLVKSFNSTCPPFQPSHRVEEEERTPSQPHLEDSLEEAAMLIDNEAIADQVEIPGVRINDWTSICDSLDNLDFV